MITLQEFIHQYDREGSIILLEGKRDVLEHDKEKLFALGQLLASKTQYILFRSGNAGGSDQFFAEGVVSVNRNRLQVITPYSGHRKKANQAYQTISLDDIDIANEANVIYQSKTNKSTQKLIEKYVSGVNNSYTIKAAYIIRDTIKVIGTNEIRPATFGIFYDDLANPKMGGTGHTMHICEINHIPFINQLTWFKWLEQ